MACTCHPTYAGSINRRITVKEHPENLFRKLMKAERTGVQTSGMPKKNYLEA
jgi:hypothetical protein